MIHSPHLCYCLFSFAVSESPSVHLLSVGDFIICLTLYLFHDLCSGRQNQISSFLFSLFFNSFIHAFRLFGDCSTTQLQKTCLPSCCNYFQAICPLVPSDAAAYPCLAGGDLHSLLSAHHTLTSSSFFSWTSACTTSIFCKVCPFLTFIQALFLTQTITLFPEDVRGG